MSLIIWCLAGWGVTDLTIRARKYVRDAKRKKSQQEWARRRITDRSIKLIEDHIDTDGPIAS